MKRFGVLAIGCMMMVACAGKRPVNLGVHDGRLTDCPSSPNCVSSQAADPGHGIAPFRYTGEREDAFKRLKAVVKAYERTTVVAERDDYLHVEFKTAIMGFVDDVEFYFPAEKVIHVRSASRLGYSDLGVNRKRVEKLRQMFTAELER